MVNQIAGTTAPSPGADGADQGASPDGADYRAWDWPVTLRGDHVRLNLEPDLVALIIPIMLATQVTAILTRRRCPPPVLVYPYSPEHQVLLVGERYEVALSWPPGVHRITGTLPLPPTMTPHGPITWVRPPRENSLRQCREIDIRAAVRMAADGSPNAASRADRH